MTEMEAVELYADEFDRFPAGLMREKIGGNWYEMWAFEGPMDEFERDCAGDDAIGSCGPTHEPMGDTWFIPYDPADVHWIEEHRDQVAQCGFTLILDADDRGLFALGIDGAGHGFTDEHWLSLYRARGLRWHDTGEEA